MDMTQTVVPDAGPVRHEANEALRRLAEAHGVSTEYWDYQGHYAAPSQETLEAVLAAMGVRASTQEEIATSLKEVELAPWRRVLPPSVVVRGGASHVLVVHVPDGAVVRAKVDLEDGGVRRLAQAEDWTPAPAREVDGVLTSQASFVLPKDLPLGWHLFTSDAADDRLIVILYRRCAM